MLLGCKYLYCDGNVQQLKQGKPGLCPEMISKVHLKHAWMLYRLTCRAVKVVPQCEIAEKDSSKL